MYIIQNILAYANQQQILTLDDGSQVTLALYYSDTQQGWYFSSIVWTTFTLSGFRIVNSPNMLYQYQNQIPFGIGCATLGNREPSQLEDFTSGASTLYLLTSDDVDSFTSYITNGNAS